VAATDIALLTGLIFAAAAIYSAVGHAGASGYIAAMALFGVSPATMKPTALTLNILVATLATYRWNRAGLVAGRPLAPLLTASIPAAFIGGAIQLPGVWYRLLIGIVLMAAAFRLFASPRGASAGCAEAAAVGWPAGLVTGASVGLLSGLTGTGGGIFLTPMLLLFGWAGARQASGITAPFILVNSIAGLAGNLLSLRGLPAELPYYMIAALLGAFVGVNMGIKWMSPIALQRVLAAVLCVAALKFILV
jgi:uncharacterized membrane protein YfcA